MRNFILFSALFTAAMSANAQQTPTPQTRSEEIERAVFRTEGVTVQEFDGRKQGTIGTPYIFTDWAVGTITLIDSQQVTIDWVFNINGETGQLVAKNSADGAIKGIYYNDILQIRVKDGLTVRTFRPIKLTSTNTFVMCEVLFEGATLNLYKQWGKKFMKSDYVERGVYTSGRINDEYVAETNYWADMGKKNIIKLDASVKKLAESVPTKQSLIEQYVKENKLKGQVTDNKLIPIFEFLDAKEAAK